MSPTSAIRRAPASGVDLFASALALPEPVARPAPEPVWPPVCATCGGPGIFGFGCFIKDGRRTGTWFCQEHKGDSR